MTCRERLEIEHPEKINPISWGGCEGCPGTYDYSDDKYPRCPYGRPNGSNCTKCWDSEIPEKSAKPEEFAPGTSYAEFADGHKEEVFYYSMAPDGGYILFATRSGIYLFEDRYEEICMHTMFSEYTELRPFLRQRHFYRISYDVGGDLIRDSIDYIKTVMIDTRIKHDYSVTLKDGRTVTGSVWVERDATVETINKAVMDDAVATITT